MGSVLVTGATGRVGRAVAERLVLAGESVISAVRDPASADVVPGTECTITRFCGRQRAHSVR